MVQINFAHKQVNAKIVYYGPGMSGKTTNLEVVHQRAPEQNKGELTSISTDGDRTLFFDFMPLDLGTVAGMRTCFQIYTVPGQVYYNSTRKLVLQGVDGVVFVADSSAAMRQENLDSLRNLEENLNEYGKSLVTLPHVIQFNKRDLPDAMPVDELNALLNANNAPCFEAVANTGQGVFPTLKALAARVLETIHQQSGGTAAPRSQAVPSPARMTPAPQHPGQPLPHPGQYVGGPQPAVPRRAGAEPQPVAAQGMRSAAPMQPTATVTAHASAMATAQQPLSRPMLVQPPAVQAPPMYAPAQPGVPPVMNSAGILTQTGFHSAALPQMNAQPAAPAPAMGQPTLHIAPRGTLGTQSRSSGPGAGHPGQIRRNEPAAAPGRKQPVVSGAAKTAAAGRALEGTRFRPRGGNRVEARPTPVAKGSNRLYTGIFVGLALAVGAVLTRVILSFF